jgi:hypothetical protein
MAMIAFYAGLIIGIFVGGLLLSLFSFFLAGGRPGLSIPGEICPQKKPQQL